MKPNKPQAVMIPTDDCTVDVDGVEYAIHEGETVTVHRGAKVRAIKLQSDLAKLKPMLDGAQGDPSAQQALAGALGDRMDEVVAYLGSVVTAWTWTDDDGVPLPQPKDNPDVFYDLRLEELLYLVAAGVGETPGEQKNGLRPLLTIS